VPGGLRKESAIRIRVESNLADQAIAEALFTPNRPEPLSAP
jgi:hypothetical protein